MPQQIGIFLDDERDPEDVTWLGYPEDVKWLTVRDEDSFKDVTSFLLMSNFLVNTDFIISFDHDIQRFDKDGVETTGYTLLKWLVYLISDWKTSTPTCYFHTQNIIGKKNMESYWNNYLDFKEKEHNNG